MPLSPIVVDVAPQPVAQELVQRLLNACTEAANATECVLADDSTERERPSAVAIVSWDTELSVRIEVGIRRDERSSWQTRELGFYEADAPEERWRSVGFAIATMVGEVQGAAKPQQPGAGASASKDTKPSVAPGNAAEAVPPKREPSPRSAARARPASRAAPRSSPSMSWCLSGGALVGPGLAHGPWRAGGALDLAIVPEPFPLFFYLGGSYARTLGISEASMYALSADWLTLVVGLGRNLLADDHSIVPSLRVETRLQRLDVTASGSNATDVQGRWLVGGAAAFRLTFLNQFALRPFIGAGASVWAGMTDVAVRGSAVSSSPVLGGELDLGVSAVLR